MKSDLNIHMELRIQIIKTFLKKVDLLSSFKTYYKTKVVKTDADIRVAIDQQNRTESLETNPYSLQ